MILYVPDTHALNWYFTADKQLSRGAKAALDSIEAGAAHAYVSTMVLAEIMYLVEKGRTTIKYDELLAHLVKSPNYTIVDVTLDILEAAKQAQGAVEVFDRLIAATAIFMQAKLITRDTVLSNLKNVETVW